MAMGFELQDCQDAINFGKTNAESAVEWYVIFPSTSSRLKLMVFFK